MSALPIAGPAFRSVQTTYRIDWAHGISERHDTYEDALAAVAAVLTEPEIGHDGDITEGGERTLFWASAELAEDDDGQRAAGAIRKVAS